ncbi:hypothetical protein FHW36_1011058 [Chitinophaga polysaccharea]|uniref:Uncharacterized protein n=1 Tax=Chitinophaga polysaccharea TaxID=1293035 RepID=A0A561Q438_9BACT|nr:hypothetical protein FHW36_1011058 [Chitinophaga polysaccharea]
MRIFIGMLSGINCPAENNAKANLLLKKRWRKQRLNEPPEP